MEEDAKVAELSSYFPIFPILYGKEDLKMFLNLSPYLFL